MSGVGAKSSGEKAASRHRAFVRNRTTLLFVVYAVLFLALAGRLFFIQVLRSDYYLARANEIRFRPYPIPAERGSIYDRNGRVLARNINTVSVFAEDTRQIDDIPGLAAKLAPILGKEASDVEARLRSRRGFVYLVRQVDAGIGDAIRMHRRELPGIGYSTDTKRDYPAGPLAAQIIGFTNIDNHGAEGLEKVLDEELTGKPGEYNVELDGARREIPNTRREVRPKVDGKDVYLTIDITIQHIAEQALASLGEVYKPQYACAVVMDVATGEILALANYPTYDPNKARSVSPALWRNRAVADLYEPGSTLKAVTVAAGLNEGFAPHAPVAYCTGREKMKGGSVPCVLHRPFLDGHGATDMYRIIEHSCNIGAAHVALKLGPEKLRHYEKEFGLLDRLDAGFGCEAVGLPIPDDEWRRQIKIANVGFGQGIAVTPLQMTSVFATIANDGMRMQPEIIREIRDANGSVCRSFKPKLLNRPITEETAAELTKMLRVCVDTGTGKPARIDGRTVAGKTGSAQVARSDGRGYESGAYISSFMGFAPAIKPRLAIAVVVTRPKGSHWGSTVAAPVFQEIGEKSLWYLKVTSDAPVEKEGNEKAGSVSPVAQSLRSLCRGLG